jgi:RNA polymerase sigma factor (sigma-70 family)
MIGILKSGYRIRNGSGFSQASATGVTGGSIAIISDMSLEQLLDEELIARYRSAAAAGEREEYVNQLFRRNYSKVARWCLRFTDDRESAVDLAQEIFFKAFQNLSSFQGQSKFSTWLFVIARNHCLNAARSDSRQATTLAMDDGEAFLLDIADGAATPYSHAERESSAKLVRELLNEALNETERKVFTLHYGDDLPLDAITRLLGLENQSGAKAFIVSAKRKLARLSQQWKARGQYKGI